MATKWKKWNNKIGFLAFFLSINMLIASVFGFASAAINYNVGPGLPSKDSKAEQTRDYQYRRQFEHYMGSMLLSFLDMACGEYSDYSYESGYYGYNGYSGIDRYVSDTVSETTATATETAAEAGALTEEIPQAEQEATDLAATERQEQEFAASGTDYASSETEILSKKERRRCADNFHDNLKNDKNLLYEISYNGKTIYTNMDGIAQTDALSIQNLPAGYNFYLHFDGTKATAGKDGEQIDLYGDGIYRENASWRIPGYKNFTAKERWARATVTMLATEDPIPYTDANYYYEYDNGYYYNGAYYPMYGGLYRISQNLQEGISQRRRAQVFLGISVFFFILYLILRKGKREADAWFAARTKRLWFECKLLLLAGVPLLLFFVSFKDNWALVREYTYLLTEDSGISFLEFFTELGNLVPGTQDSPAMAMIFFWLLYFFCNDIRKNQKIWQNGITAKLVRAYRAREAKLPVARKLILRLLPAFILSAILAVCIFICGLSIVWEKMDYGGEISPALGAQFAATLLLLAALFAAEYRAQKKIKLTGLGLERLAKAVADIKNGSYDKEALFTDSSSELYFIAEDLEKIYDGVEQAVAEQTKSERMKVELVANVSHDIKTPLTSIISYIQLLKQEEGLPDYVMDYVRILDEKAERLKQMVQDIFSVSKAASGQLEVEKKELDFGKLLEQTLADMQEQIADSPVTLKTEFPSHPVTVLADGARMYRVFQNLVSNALKYSLEGSRVYLTLQEEGGCAAACIRSTSKEELCDDIDFTERFTRGDKSRTDGGSGLGLSIAKSFTEACGGSFQVEVIADLFVVTVALPLKMI